MPEASQHGTPPRDNEAATLWADLGEGARNYRRMRRDRWIDLKVRQYHRRLEAEEIGTAPLEGETVAGYHWREAWIIVQAMLFIDGKYDEMEGPQQWKQWKLRNRLKNDG